MVAGKLSLTLCLAALCAAPPSLLASRNAAWMEDIFQPHLGVSYLQEQYDKIAVKGGTLPLGAIARRVSLFGYIAINPQWEWSAEAAACSSSIERFYFDHASLGGRYQFFDEFQGDPCSASLGFALQATEGRALQDPSFFHHAEAEVVLQAAVGKEWSGCGSWLGRCWIECSAGQGVRGYPWLEAAAAFSRQFLAKHALAAQARYRQGLGSQAWDAGQEFPGYRTLAYRALDVSGQYTLSTIYGSLSLSCGRRAWARYAPRLHYFFTVSFDYPLSF